MSLTDESRALLALHLVALRRHGWTAAKSVALVAQGLPGGDAHRELDRVAQALDRGERPEAGADPFLALLAQGEAAGPEALLESVKSSEVAWAARRSRQQAAFLLTLALGGAGFTLGLATLLIRAWQEGVSNFGALPLVTQLTFDAVAAVGYLGPALLLALAALPWAVPARWLPGVARFQAAARLRQFAAAMAAMVSAEAAAKLVDPSTRETVFDGQGLGLTALERKAGAFLLARDGPESGARTLAAELESEARATSARFAGWSPALGLGVVLAAAIPLVAAFLLPVFAIAGAVK